jgi:hypothetical protein
MNRVHQPLHDLRQFKPVGGLDTERERRPFEGIENGKRGMENYGDRTRRFQNSLVSFL